MFKKIVIGFFALAILGSIINAFQDYSNPEVREANKARVQEQIAAQAKERAELDGTSCTKDGKAIIGESQSRTLKCGWGKPKRINRTHTATVSREQWVYDGGYLYFTNGVLTAIQN